MTTSNSLKWFFLFSFFPVVFSSFWIARYSLKFSIDEAVATASTFTKPPAFRENKQSKVNKYYTIERVAYGVYLNSLYFKFLRVHLFHISFNSINTGSYNKHTYSDLDVLCSSLKQILFHFFRFFRSFWVLFGIGMEMCSTSKSFSYKYIEYSSR